MDAVTVKCNIPPTMSRPWFCLFTTLVSSIFPLICLHFPKSRSHFSDISFYLCMFVADICFYILLISFFFLLTATLLPHSLHLFFSLSLRCFFFHFSSSGLGFWWQMEPWWHHSGKDDWDWQAYWGHTGPVQHQSRMLSHTRLVMLPKLPHTFWA